MVSQDGTNRFLTIFYYADSLFQAATSAGAAPKTVQFALDGSSPTVIDPRFHDIHEEADFTYPPTNWNNSSFQRMSHLADEINLSFNGNTADGDIILAFPVPRTSTETLLAVLVGFNADVSPGSQFPKGPAFIVGSSVIKPDAAGESGNPALGKATSMQVIGNGWADKVFAKPASAGGGSTEPAPVATSSGSGNLLLGAAIGAAATYFAKK